MTTALDIAVILVAILAIAAVLSAIHRRYLCCLAAERSGESICQFARSFNYRRLDTGVIRAVYEEVQAYIRPEHPAFPLRATDHFEDTLRIDPENVEELISDIAQRCGRSLDDAERNPHWSGLYTVGALVHFLCAQPKTQVA